MKQFLFTLLLFLSLSGCDSGKSSTTMSSSSIRKITKLTNCGEIKDKNSCNTKGVVENKECIFMVDECMVKSKGLQEFMDKDQSFKSTIDEGNDIFGSDHGEHPLWDKICNKNSLKNKDTKTSVDEIIFDFSRGKNSIKLRVNCTDGGPAEYNFLYKAYTLKNGALRLHFDKGTETLVEEIEYATNKWQQEQLDFFIKPPWFYNHDKGQIKGSSQLVYMGFRKGNEKELEIKSEEDIDSAIAFAKTDAYGIKLKGTRNGAVTLILNK